MENQAKKSALRKEERAKAYVAPKEPKSNKRKAAALNSGNAVADIDVQALKTKLKQKEKAKAVVGTPKPATAYVLDGDSAPDKKKKRKKSGKQTSSV